LKKSRLAFLAQIAKGKQKAKNKRWGNGPIFCLLVFSKELLSFENWD